MLNDRSTPIALLESRRSGRPREMVEPGPSADQLERILRVAARTPDHGKLAPWRFITVGNDRRDALSALLRQALVEEDECATAAHHEKADQFARQAPALVVMISSPIENHKIPVWEQELSCGAVAMNLLHAAHALGYVGGWLTGWQCYSRRVQASFCEPGERIAGFIFLGTPGRELEERTRPELGDLVRSWAPKA